MGEKKFKEENFLKLKFFLKTIHDVWKDKKGYEMREKERKTTVSFREKEKQKMI